MENLASLTVLIRVNYYSW